MGHKRRIAIDHILHLLNRRTKDGSPVGDADMQRLAHSTDPVDVERVLNHIEQVLPGSKDYLNEIYRDYAQKAVHLWRLPTLESMTLDEVRDEISANIGHDLPDVGTFKMPGKLRKMACRVDPSEAKASARNRPLNPALEALRHPCRPRRKFSAACQKHRPAAPP